MSVASVENTRLGRSTRSAKVKIQKSEEISNAELTTTRRSPRDRRPTTFRFNFRMPFLLRWK